MDRSRPESLSLSESMPKQNKGVSAASFLNKIQNEDDQNRLLLEESIIEEQEESHIKQMLSGKLNELRHEILNFTWFKDKPQDEIDFDKVPNFFNFILFGPAGSGKSSVIRTIYSALHAAFHLPEEFNKDLVIKAMYSNEGTTKFTKVELKKPEQNTLKAGSKTYRYPNPGIYMYDTRGQISLNDKEKESLNIMMDVDLANQGRVRENVEIQHRKSRYAYLLYEFWKSDAELFPEEIFKSEVTLGTKPHCILFVFDGSHEEVPNSEEVEFFRGVLNRCRARRTLTSPEYFKPQIVLTRADRLEELIRRDIREGKIEGNASDLVAEEKDRKIESIASKLGIPRDSVHFIENYHEKRRHI